jgi:hypothetical protein
MSSAIHLNTLGSNGSSKSAKTLGGIAASYRVEFLPSHHGSPSVLRKIPVSLTKVNGFGTPVNRPRLREF